MKFLADESCDFTIIRRLRNSGIEILSISEYSPGISDEEVLSLARTQERIVITEDRDFGRLVHLGSEEPRPVLYLRYPFYTRHSIAERVLTLIETKKEILKNSFIVVEPGRIRVRKYK